MINENTKRRTFIQEHRKRARGKKSIFLRLTSLIDVFTILLIFLIKNFSTRPELTLLAQNLRLPISTATKAPDISTTISATQQAILINGEFVDTLENLNSQKELLNQKLYQKLIQSKEKILMVARQNPEIQFQGKIIIQADKDISYKVIKRLIYTCGQAEFGKISLHVLNEAI